MAAQGSGPWAAATVSPACPGGTRDNDRQSKRGAMADDLRNEHRTDIEPDAGPVRLVGVYRDEQSAREAAEAAEAAGAWDVEVAAEPDRVAALRGEMREEVEHAWGGPSVGVYTKEMARNVPLWTAAVAALGILVALPLGFLGPESVPLVTRLVVAGFVGAVFGGTVGFLVGGGFFDVRRKARDELAAEAGVVVGAWAASGDVARAMCGSNAIRVDRVASDGQPVDTLTTDG